MNERVELWFFMRYTMLHAYRGSTMGLGLKREKARYRNSWWTVANVLVAAKRLSLISEGSRYMTETRYCISLTERVGVLNAKRHEGLVPVAGPLDIR